MKLVSMLLCVPGTQLITLTGSFEEIDVKLVGSEFCVPRLSKAVEP